MMRLNLLRRSQHNALATDGDDGEDDQMVLIPQGTPSKGKEAMPVKPFLKELSFKGLDVGEEENTATTEHETPEEADFSFPAFGAFADETAAEGEELESASDHKPLKQPSMTNGLSAEGDVKPLKQPSGKFDYEYNAGNEVDVKPLKQPSGKFDPDDIEGNDSDIKPLKQPSGKFDPDDIDGNEKDEEGNANPPSKSKKSKERSSKKSSSKSKKKGNRDHLSQSGHAKKKSAAPDSPTRGVARRYSMPSSLDEETSKGPARPPKIQSRTQSVGVPASPARGRKRLGLGALMRSQPAMQQLEDDLPSVGTETKEYMPSWLQGGGKNNTLTRNSDGDIPLDCPPEGLIAEEAPPTRGLGRAVSAESALPEIEAASKARKGKRRERPKSDFKKSSKTSSKKSDDLLETGSWHARSVSTQRPRKDGTKHKRRPSLGLSVGGREEGSKHRRRPSLGLSVGGREEGPKHKRRPSLGLSVGGRPRSKSMDHDDPLAVRSCHARTCFNSADDIFASTGATLLTDDEGESSDEKSDGDVKASKSSEKKSKTKKSKKSSKSRVKSSSKSLIDSKSAIQDDDAVTKVKNGNDSLNKSFVQLDFADLGVAAAS